MTPELVNTVGLISGMTGVLLVPIGLESGRRRRRWLRISSFLGVGLALIFLGFGALVWVAWSNPQVDGNEVNSLAAGGA
jgi:hypothetical protein